MNKFDYKILDTHNVFVNQILPHKNKWAWDLYLKGEENNWVPNHVPMSKDIEQWQNGVLSDTEKLVIKRCLGFFAGSESLVSNNLLLNIYSYLCDAECRQYIGRQVHEENLHNHTIVYICDSLNLPIKEVYEAYDSIPVIKDKDDFLMRVTTQAVTNNEEKLKNLIIYYLVCEGMLFYSSFAILLSFGKQNKIPGICQQIFYTLRDEGQHITFGVNVINTIIREYPELWTSSFKKQIEDLFLTAYTLEERFAREVLENGILGLNPDILLEYVGFIGNRRLESIGLRPMFSAKKNPFPWLSEVVDLDKCGNFFETTVQNYRTGALEDDF